MWYFLHSFFNKTEDQTWSQKNKRIYNESVWISLKLTLYFSILVSLQPNTFVVAWSCTAGLHRHVHWPAATAHRWGLDGDLQPQRRWHGHAEWHTSSARWDSHDGALPLQEETWCLQHACNIPGDNILSMYQFPLASRRCAGCDLPAPSSTTVVSWLCTLLRYVGCGRRNLARDPASVDLRVPVLPSLRLERLHE